MQLTWHFPQRSWEYIALLEWLAWTAHLVWTCSDRFPPHCVGHSPEHNQGRSLHWTSCSRHLWIPVKTLTFLCLSHQNISNTGESKCAQQLRQINKRPMGHLAHLRKQFKSINTYDYIITLIKRRKKNIINFITYCFFIWILTKGSFVPNWLKLAQWFWRKDFFNFVNVFSLFL